MSKPLFVALFTWAAVVWLGTACSQAKSDNTAWHAADYIGPEEASCERVRALWQLPEQQRLDIIGHMDIGWTKWLVGCDRE